MRRRPGWNWAGGAWPRLARGVMRVSVQPRPTLTTRVLTTPVCAGEGGRRSEKPAYGQSQCVTFGLEFTLGSDAHADELVGIVELQRRRHRV